MWQQLVKPRRHLSSAQVCVAVQTCTQEVHQVWKWPAALHMHVWHSAEVVRFYCMIGIGALLPLFAAAAAAAAGLFPPLNLPLKRLEKGL